MFLGLINQHCKNISYDVIGEKSGSTPEMRKKGNPFLGEELFIHWEKLLNDNPEMTVRLERNYFICCVNLFLGERCLPRKLCICDGKGTELTSYTAETGKSIQEKMLSLPVNETMKTLCIKFDLDLSCLALERIELWGAESDGEALFPIPCHMESSGKRYSVSQFDAIVSEDAEGRLAAEILSERFFEESGRKLSVAGKHPIILRKRDGLKENGYRLEVSCRGALIIGSDLRGLVMGAETFLKLIDAAGSVPETVIEDAPAVSFRGVHLMLPPADQLEFTKRLVKYLLSPMGYNYIILEIAGGMRFDSHPEINEAVLAANARAKAGIWPPFPHSEVAGGGVVEKEDLADLITYIRRFGIDVIPEVQSLGHVQFLTLPHPDIAELPAGGLQTEETDLRLADIPPNDFYAHSFCPSNPKSYMILFDILDEIIEVTKPRKFVHMGHDEVYQIGVCPVCRRRDPAELFASDIRRIHDHLAEKGLRMMIWSDMLQPVSSYRTVHASSMIPKDIVLLDFIWYFHMEEDIETNLTEQNFSVVIGNLYSSHFPRYEKRIRQKGVIGAEVSTWVVTDEEQLGCEGKIYDILYCSQMLWSEEYKAYLRYAYDRLINTRIPKLREQLHGERSPLLHEGDISIVYRSPHYPKIAGEPHPVRIQNIHRCYDSMVFTHTASECIYRKPWAPLPLLGNYHIRYSDGREELVPVAYGKQIGFWNRRHNQPLTQMYFRHTGYPSTYFTDGVEERDCDGRVLTYYRYEWKNPHPDLPIEAVWYCPVDSRTANVFTQSIEGVREKSRE